MTKRRSGFKRFFVGEGPSQPPYHLTNRRVYILPTRQGLVFGLLLFAMLLGSINYNNNLGYILTFLLASLSVVNIFMTYRNLLYLRIGPASTAPVFAGKFVGIPIQIDNLDYSNRLALEYHLPGENPIICDIPSNARFSVQLPVCFNQRGYQTLPRFIIASSFPMGMFRAWSHVHLDQSLLVYPKPGLDRNLPQFSSGSRQGEIHHAAGDDDFDSLRNYQPGDSFYRIDWKSAARHRVLQTKQYIGSANAELWINWNDSRLIDIEERISQLTQWILLAHGMGFRYGFKIPNVEYLPNTGLTHRNNCLKALALFGA